MLYLGEFRLFVFVESENMHIDTARLIIRDLMEQDAEALFEIKYDKQVMKYNPTFFDPFDGKSVIDSIKAMISFYQSLSEKSIVCHEQLGSLLAVCLKDSGEVIGVITLNLNSPINEWHIGWYFLSQFTGKVYASEAGTAASDYFLEALSLDYISASIRDDNPASFRTAQKSGFRLIERRIGYDYDNADCNEGDLNEVNGYFNEKNDEVGSSDYYFQKFNKKSLNSCY